jgi:aminotransferase in exopolysaccharide biosynthesis
MFDIPLSVPSLKGREWQYIKECIDTGWVSSAGKYVELFEEKIAEYTSAKYAVACVNGTSALQVSLHLAGVQTGDEVIVPTLTFIAPVNAVAYNGASPVFMDADNYYNIDSQKTIEFINKKTVFKDGFTFNKKTNRKITAIIPVHVFGHTTWLDELVPLCEERNIAIVEDAAESMGTRYINGEYSGKHTGTIGLLGCLSFNGNKIITTGGGGMILTDDVDLAEKAKYLTKQAKDDRVRYIHDEIGYNFRLTNIQAALGVAQLEQLSGFLKRKGEIFHQYQNALNGVDGLSIADVPDYADTNHWVNVLQIDNEVYGEDRDSIMQRLEKNGIQTRPVWALNNLQKPYKDCQSYKIEKAVELVNKSLCLPSSTNLTNDNFNQVITQLNG